jgi:tetratricopeptide (TPR) repeat protein
MATYKKRGNKENRKGKEELAQDQSTTAEVFNTLDESASKTEAWVAKNQKFIFIFVAAAAIVVLGFLGYREYILEPKEADAANEMFQAQSYFEQAVVATEKDSLYTLALTGGEGKYGLIDIINNYSGTNAANLASYSAGMAYLNLKDYQNAIKYLSDFSSDDAIYSALAKGGIGDAFMQLNQTEDALGYYKKAASLNANGFTTPTFLMKAGVAALELGKATEALGFFNRIKDEFSESVEAKNIEVFIGKAENLK